jgi:hypothetical protein
MTSVGGRTFAAPGIFGFGLGFSAYFAGTVKLARLEVVGRIGTGFIDDVG